MSETALEEKVEFQEFTPRQELFLATSLRQARLELAGREETEDQLRAGIREFIAAYPEGITSLSQLSAEDIEAYVKESLSGREYLHYDKLLATVTKLSNFTKEELASQSAPEEIVQQIGAEIEERLDNLGAKRGIRKALRGFLKKADLRFKRAVLITTSSLLFSFGTDAFQKFTSPLPVFAVSDREQVQNLTESELEDLGVTTTTVESTATALPSPTPSPQPSPTLTLTETPFPTQTPKPPVVPTVEAEIKEEREERLNFLEVFYQKVENLRRARAESDPNFLRRINKELNEHRINAYIIGLDKPQSGVSRADTIVVASYDITGGNFTLMRIPRDLHAPESDDIQEKYRGRPYRINAMTVFGDSEDVRRILEDATGLSMDVGMYANFEDLSRIVDVIGGIDLDISPDFVERYAREFRGIGIELKPGVNYLNAQQALHYARVRKKDSDYHRGARQLQVLQTIAEKVRQNPALGRALLNLEFRLAGDFSYAELARLAGEYLLSSSKISVTFDTFAPWGQLLESGRLPKDRYQTFLRGAPTNPEDPLEYWYPLRNVLANHLRAQTP